MWKKPLATDEGGGGGGFINLTARETYLLKYELEIARD